MHGLKGLLPSLLVAVLVIGVVGAMPQLSMAHGSTSSVKVSIAWFVVPVGEPLAFEFARTSDVHDSAAPIYIENWTLLGEEGDLLSGEPNLDATEIDEWIGTVSLRDENDEPLPPGDYTLEIGTTLGTFSVGIRAIDSVPSGRYSLSAAANGISLKVYRLVTEEDAGRMLDLRIGDQIMVLLEGNPTTGYGWSSDFLSESAILQPIGDPEYRPTVTQPAMVGSGGAYVFRYEVVGAGMQTLRFVYKRPWETTESDREFSFDAFVHP